MGGEIIEISHVFKNSEMRVPRSLLYKNKWRLNDHDTSKSQYAGVLTVSWIVKQVEKYRDYIENLLQMLKPCYTMQFFMQALDLKLKVKI